MIFFNFLTNSTCVLPSFYLSRLCLLISSIYCQGDPAAIARCIRDSVKQDMDRCLEEAKQHLRTPPGTKLALIIDGKCLMYALEPALRVNLLNLSLNCSSVVCCRVSPLQKAQVTYVMVMLFWMFTLR